MKLVSSSNELYQTYQSRMRQVADIKNAMALLQWDEETYMPVKGAGFRGQQLATLSEMAHQLFTREDLGDLLEELSGRGDLTGSQLANVRLSLGDFTKQKKLSASFVRSLSEAVSASFHAWVEARKENSFALFEGPLQRVLELKRQQADLLGYEGHPYNALLDEFEKGATVQLLDRTFDTIRTPLKHLYDKILGAPAPQDAFLRQYYPRQQQWDFGMSMLRRIGFDLEAGRQDISEHPFTTSFNRNDVRLTTRIDEHDFGQMCWSCLHEAGHGLYEQGLEESEYGLPLGEYASLGIHESQSRLWENNIGRGLPFWTHYYPELQALFAGQLGQVDLFSFYKAINKVQPSLIRTEADELSYHFHILIRYDLERMLMEGNLSVRDIPAAWNEKYRRDLDVCVPDDKRGCLQDVHWSHGSFGYFPTYSLGSFYAAQIYHRVETLYPGFSAGLQRGEHAILLDWLRLHIHQPGRRYTSGELCQMSTGEPLHTGYFMKYILDKYTFIYNL